MNTCNKVREKDGDWVNYFREIAEVVKTKSKDSATQIGAVIVGKDNEIVSTGYNSFPRGIDDNKIERQERPEKYYWMEHAERNAIINAARIGVSTKGTTMYLTCGVPCCDCTRAIINAGVSQIYIYPSGSGAKGKIWDEHLIRSIEMFKEAGITINFYNIKKELSYFNSFELISFDSFFG
jgi:dCMP deaminase